MQLGSPDHRSLVLGAACLCASLLMPCRGALAEESGPAHLARRARELVKQGKYEAALEVNQLARQRYQDPNLLLQRCTILTSMCQAGLEQDPRPCLAEFASQVPDPDPGQRRRVEQLQSQMGCTTPKQMIQPLALSAPQRQQGAQLPARPVPPPTPVVRRPWFWATVALGALSLVGGGLAIALVPQPHENVVWP